MTGRLPFRSDRRPRRVRRDFFADDQSRARPDYQSIEGQILQVHGDSHYVPAGNLFAPRTTISTTITTMRAYDDSLEPCRFAIDAGAGQFLTSLLVLRISREATFDAAAPPPSRDCT